MNEGWGFFGLIAIVGLVGSFLLVRFLRGARAVLGCLGWSVLPFVVIAFILAAERDASLSADRAHYDFWFGFVLLSLVVAVPWFVAGFIGSILGAILRKGQPAPGFETPAASSSHSGEGPTG